MVTLIDTTTMLPDEYSHYVLRYSAIQSGLAGYNLSVPEDKYDEEIRLILCSAYESLFASLMDDLEDFPQSRRAKALNYYIEQISRFDFANSDR